MAVTRTSEDAFGLAMGNQRRSLETRIVKIRRRLLVPVGRRGGYATKEERFEKQRRLQVLEHRLVDERL